MYLLLSQFVIEISNIYMIRNSWLYKLLSSFSCLLDPESVQQLALDLIIKLLFVCVVNVIYCIGKLNLCILKQMVLDSVSINDLEVPGFHQNLNSSQFSPLLIQPSEGQLRNSWVSMKLERASSVVNTKYLSLLSR